MTNAFQDATGLIDPRAVMVVGNSNAEVVLGVEGVDLKLVTDRFTLTQIPAVQFFMGPIWE